MNIKSFLDKENNITHKGPVVDSVERFDVIECLACGFKHVVPFPKKEELNILYKENFYTTEKPHYFKSMEEDLDWWMITYRSYYNLFEKHTKGRRLLDIGSGPGYFLKCGKEMGWETLGIEPSPQAFEYSTKLGVAVKNSFFSEKVVSEIGFFDVVYANMVIEHARDPLSIIKNAFKILKPGGLICVISPNEYNPLQKILKEKLGFSAWWVAPPQHLNYFDFDSIRTVLKNLGFEILENLGTFPMEVFLLAGENYVGNDALGKKCHQKRMLFESNLYKHGKEILLNFYKFLGQNKIGRDFIVLARKK